MNVFVRIFPPVSFIQRQTGRLRNELENLEPLWERLKPVMSAIEEERWSTEGYGAWPGGPDYHGLVRTGDLKSSLVDPGRAADTGPDYMTWGTAVPYAHWHQDGGTIPGRPPQRVILELRPEDRQGKIEPEVVRWLNETVAKLW